MKPKSILLLAPAVSGGGGIQRVNLMLIAANHQLGNPCTVLSLNDPSGQGTHSPNGPLILGFSANKLAYIVAVGKALWFGRFDCVLVSHVNLLVMVAFLLLPKRINRPTVWLMAHGIEIWTGINGLKRFAARQIRGVLSVSRYTQERVRSQLPMLSEERFVHFPLALMDSWSRATSTAEDTTPASVDDAPFILSVTRLDSRERYKGLVPTMEALSMLADARTNHVVAGSGSDLEYLKRAAARLGVSQRVKFVGHVSDAELAGLYAKCIAFVLPSGNEGFGLVFLEAMQFGAPVIAAREKGALDVVKNAVTGFLVDFGDVVALKSTIDMISTQSSIRLEVAEHARHMVEQGEFSFPAFVSRVERLLNR